MARIRTIKPEFFTSEDIFDLTPLAHLFYAFLWCEADREGRIKWKPRTLAARFFPEDDYAIDDLAQQLVDQGHVKFYEVKEQVFCFLTSFTEHQVINNREKESSFPAYSPDACVTRESGGLLEGREGREGKGREGNARVPFSQEFLDWWEEYPHKVGKQDAWKAWQKAIKQTDLETLHAGLKGYKRHKPEDRPWCNPSTWLNGGRWADEPFEAKAADTSWRDKYKPGAQAPLDEDDLEPPAFLDQRVKRIPA